MLINLIWLGRVLQHTWYIHTEVYLASPPGKAYLTALFFYSFWNIIALNPLFHLDRKIYSPSSKPAKEVCQSVHDDIYLGMLLLNLMSPDRRWKRRSGAFQKCHFRSKIRFQARFWVDKNDHRWRTWEKHEAKKSACFFLMKKGNEIVPQVYLTDCIIKKPLNILMRTPCVSYWNWTIWLIFPVFSLSSSLFLIQL